jgi:hypothetical protein
VDQKLPGFPHRYALPDLPTVIHSLQKVNNWLNSLSLPLISTRFPKIMEVSEREYTRMQDARSQEPENARMR